MRVIAHLSDLHFGAERADAVEALARDLDALRPSLVIVSGDLTQRARRRQFAAARDFLARLRFPQLVIPGNHDVPLYDVLRRFLAPLRRYRGFIAEEVNPVFSDDELIVVGLNTARSATWKNGRLSVEQLKLLERRLRPEDPRGKIVVTHHPFMPPPDDAGVALVGRSAKAVPVLERLGVDLLLAGHLHRQYAANVQARFPGTQRAILCAQAGTAVSGRVRAGEPNSYNVILFHPPSLEIEVRVLSERGRFESLTTQRYERSASGWLPGARPPDAAAVRPEN